MYWRIPALLRSPRLIFSLSDGVDKRVVGCYVSVVCAMRQDAVEMRSITKRFPGVLANDRVDFVASCGEVHAIVGENGAGKTTLMNVLYGLHHPDSGEIRVFGQQVRILSPRTAIGLGIGMVHQHFMLIPAFTALENIILGQEPVALMLTDYAKAENQLSDLCERVGLQVDLHARVADLSVSSQQKVEIVKALFRGARILILDEPTSVLAPSEAESLLMMLRRLADEGMCIILISHKLGEVMDYSDRVTVLRQGRSVACLETRKTSREELARLMIGQEKEPTTCPPSARVGRPVLRVSNLHVVGKNGVVAVIGVCFDLRAGEIVGIAGVDGNGQRELVEALVGLRFGKGSIFLNDIDISHMSVRRRLDAGLSYIPEDRRFALIPDNRIEENIILGLHRLPPFSHFGLLREDAARRFAERLIEEYEIRAAGPRMVTRLLSGGNQQKLVLARALHCRPKVLVACQPTRGLDVGSTAQVHQRIIEARDLGAGILLVSFDLDETLLLSDRVMVMFRGRIVRVLTRQEADREKVGRLMLGAVE